MSSLVTVERVHKTYYLGEARVHALRGLSMQLEQGEFVALVGASGSGKSTLLNLIGGLDDPDEGVVSIDGMSLASLAEAERSRLRNTRLGFIFQTFNLVPVLNVYENVQLPLMIHPTIPARERDERVRAVLRDVGLESYLKHVPDKLSGGQRQRVAIARALVTEPALVLADEPTANLDSETTGTLVELMLAMNEKRKVTFLFSTHDERLMRRVQRVLHIKDGVIVS
jgi:putative ABC transport system ATP-binding protein